MAKTKKKEPKRKNKAGRNSKAVRKLGTFKGDVVITDDFDAPLPKKLIDAFEGKDEPEEK